MPAGGHMIPGELCLQRDGVLGIVLQGAGGSDSLRKEGREREGREGGMKEPFQTGDMGNEHGVESSVTSCGGDSRRL